MSGRFDDAGSNQESTISGNDETRRHRLLADARRRRVIEVLDGRHGTLTVAEVAESLAKREAADQTADAGGPLTTTLHHVHLPMLADGGVCEYDPQTRTVEVDQEALASLTGE
jgi:hypothetical protein